tara:strand:+ start:81 stop:395 length:315 start_codon:yes stop_codon:yes gene_type:complete
MKILKSLTTVFFITILLNSCSSLSDAGKVLRNDKTQTNDEFLIKKKEPLTQPPDFDSIPMPGKKPNKNSADNIERMLKNEKNKSSRSKKQSSTTENSIINQINK